MQLGGLIERMDNQSGASACRTDALTANAASPFLTDEQTLDARIRIAACNIRIGLRAHGIDEFARIERALASPGFDAQTKVTMLLRIGHQLHELGLYNEALAHNNRAVQVASQSFAIDHPLNVALHRNLAGNQYELGNLAESARILQAVRTLAERKADYPLWTETCFKLAVVAHESFDNTVAGHWLQQSLTAAELSRDNELVSRAHWWLAELNRRISRQQQKLMDPR